MEISRHQEGQHYLNQEAAQHISCKPEKSLLTMLSLIQIFESGGTNVTLSGNHTMI